MTLLETSSTTGNVDRTGTDDSIRLQPCGGGEWLVVSEPEPHQADGALALIRAETTGYACYPNAVGYGRRGPYPTLDEAFQSAVALMSPDPAH